jgi:nitrate reductase NapE component
VPAESDDDQAGSETAGEHRSWKEWPAAEGDAYEHAPEDEHQSTPPPPIDGGRSIYADFIKEQLDAQEARKVSLEQRGLAVITTSGALVTLLFGLTALSVRRATTLVIPDTAAVLLIVALVCFVLAALCAIVTNVPRSYEGVTVDALRGAVRERWVDSEAVASEMVALTRLKMLASAKKNNDAKGIALVIAMSFEILAVALVGAAVGFVLWE